MAIKTGTENDDVLDGTSSNDTLYGLGGNDTLSGGESADLLDGGAGADRMKGGWGNDIYIVDNAGDVVKEDGGQGTDTVRSSIDYTLGANVERLVLTGSAIGGIGNSADNKLTGNDANNLLDGKAGSDTMEGGAGDDRYYIDSAGDVVIEVAGGGTDTVNSSISYTLGTYEEHLALLGTAVAGTGNSSANALTGNAGANVLDGKAGNDTMAGGAGDDVYFVDSSGDVVSESDGGGTDTVNSSVDFKLGIYEENLTLLGAAVTGTGNGALNLLVGNDGANVLDGKAGNDTIDGGGGADTMIGGTGSDVFYVDNVGDVVTELAGQGTDTVFSSIDYTLGSTVENLRLIGTAVSATGNATANTLTGNDADNLLDGKGGADTMIGGLGNDTYVVDGSNDVVGENAQEGTDTVISSRNYVLGNEVENLILTGDALKGTGNALNNNLEGNERNNTLVGKAGDDTLDGGFGADAMEGGQGDDTYYVDNFGDTIVELAAGGVDTVVSDLDHILGDHMENLQLAGAAINGTGNSANNILVGNDADNLLYGLDGDDVLDGDAGNNDVYAGAGNDTVIGGKGLFDLANGGEGNDTLRFDLRHIHEDLAINVYSYLDAEGYRYSIIANEISTFETVNNTEAERFEHLEVFGGSGNDRIMGFDDAETLDGGEGDDYILGNGGDDEIRTGRGVDQVEGGQGVDTLVADFSAAIENLTITTDSGRIALAHPTFWANIQDQSGNQVAAWGFERIQILGGAGDDEIYGDDADETIDGGAGDDNIYAGDGNDTVVTGKGYFDFADGGEGDDTLRFDLRHINDNATINVDAFFWHGSYEFGIDSYWGDEFRAIGTSGFEHLEVLGGAGDDTINGSYAAETIDGGLGDDDIYAGDGNDTVISGHGFDFANGGYDEDTLRFDLRHIDEDVTIDMLVFSNSNGGYDFDVGSNGSSAPIGVYGRDFEHLDVLSGSGNDTINGSVFGETIDGGKGDDYVYAGAGDDLVRAGQGIDFVNGELGNDILIADFSAATENLVINTDYERISPPDSNATSLWASIHDQFGNQVNAWDFEQIRILGGAGNDTIDGGDADETIDGGAGDDWVVAGDGNDTVIAGSGFDFAEGNDGDDTLRFDMSANTSAVTIRIDTTPYWNGGYNFNIDAFWDDGYSHVDAYGFEHLEVLGGTGDDDIRGSDASEILDGGKGNDLVNGGGGDDLIRAGQGMDVVNGGFGNDILVADFSGATGPLSLFSESGILDIGEPDPTALWATIQDQFGNRVNAWDFEQIQILGGTRNDTINGGDADETIDGGAGDDDIYAGAGDDTVIAGKGLFDFAAGGDGDDTLRFDLRHVNDDATIGVINLSSGGVFSNFYIEGSWQFEISRVSAFYFEHFEIFGGAGDDTIHGSDADETLDGGAGDDRIVGGLGADTLVGGSGQDYFSYAAVAEGGDGEWINDFALGADGDRVDLNFAQAYPFFTIDAEHISLTQVDTDADGTIDYTAIGVDVDGGGDHFETLVNLQGVNATWANADNLFA